MDEFLQEFLIECSENLSRIDQDLVSLEKNPFDKEVLKNIFRAIHTVKGSCGMFELHRLEKIAHAAEDVLGKMRDGELTPSADTIGPVLAAVDIIKSILVKLEKDKKEPEGEDGEIIQNLHSLLNGSKNEKGPTSFLSPTEPIPELTTETVSKVSVSDQSLRVNIDVLNGLMNLVEELVLTRNQLLQFVRAEDGSKYLAPIQQLNRVTSGLQEQVMKTRMQPIGNAWGKLPRIVRDLSQSTGKKLELKMIGQDTEIDRQILQAIADPLIHCVRNSADHGIETPDLRQKNGKPPQGTISLKAFHEGGHIIIEVSDDGSGINISEVRQRAIHQGLIDKERAKQLSDTEIAHYIFEPGFSTAKQVTEVSGRGVGMDVVKSNVEKIGGHVELINAPGKGTTVRFKIPLTLAIISALIVKTGDQDGEIFAIPQAGVVELVRISTHNQQLIEEIHGAKFLRLRDKLVPLICLASSLCLDVHQSVNEEFVVVVANISDLLFGLCVDEIFDTQEIVVKPVGKLLREINLFAGSTILGNGQVVLILDVARLVSKTVFKNLNDHKAQKKASSIPEVDKSLGEKMTMLLFQGEKAAPMAVALFMVSRLEEFSFTDIEKVHNQYFVQYRGSLLPLLPCHPGIDLEKVQTGKIPAIILSDEKRSMGLVVKKILDIVEETLNIGTSGKHPGVLGPAILADQATEVIDTVYYLNKVHNEISPSSPLSMTKEMKLKFLVVDDSPLFRELLFSVLSSFGHQVVLAENGQQALEKMSDIHDVDCIISDIEMPIMDGLQLASQLKTHPVWKEIPLFALTTLDSEKDQRRGIEAGFWEYLIKFNQKDLLRIINKYFLKEISQEIAV